MKHLKSLLFFLPLIIFSACNNSKDNASEESNDESTSVTATGVDTTEGLFAVILTSKGIMIARLEPEKAPKTVANFVALSEGSMPNTFRQAGQPFYDSLKFHRVITTANGDQENFMIQGGDPLGTGEGGPGYKFKDEFSDLKFNGPGILAMANSGPETNGSQYFITVKETPFLDGKHTIFGRLISGTEIPFLIRTNDYMTKIRILRKGNKAQAYDAVKEFNKIK